MNPQLEAFYASATAFCDWAEGVAAPPDEEAIKAIHFIVDLYGRAFAMPDMFGEEEASEPSRETMKYIVDRFSELPFNAYSLCFDPLVLDDKPVVSTISDDISDIWWDVKQGIELYQSGAHAAAAWHWRFSFLHHWGKHAVSALTALHSWFSESPSAVTPLDTSEAI